MEPFEIIAHRGASGHAPENTLAAINKALEFNVDRIEVDVHQTKDERIVVIHDDTLERTTTGLGPVNEQVYDALKEFDAGTWFSPEFKDERIPLLSSVLETIKGKAKLIIEIKNGSQINPDIEKNTWKLVTQHNMQDSTVISSSRITVLNRFKSFAPEARLAKIITPKELWRSLFQNGSFMQKYNLMTHIKELHPHWSFIDNHFIEWAQNHNLPVYPWTVNKERKMRALLDRGVQGIITNFPDTANKIR
ncbi:glycerophosphodiester phosphodiesterase [candidate division KSB1 bacterium]